LQELDLSSNHLMIASHIPFASIRGQTPVGAASSSAISPKQKMVKHKEVEHEEQPSQKKMRPNGS